MLKHIFKFYQMSHPSQEMEGSEEEKKRIV